MFRRLAAEAAFSRHAEIRDSLLRRLDPLPCPLHPVSMVHEPSVKGGFRAKLQLMERREIRIICPIARDRYVEPIDGPRGGTGNAVHDFDQNRGINRLFPVPTLVVPVTEVITYLNFSGNVAAKFGEQRNDRLSSFL